MKVLSARAAAPPPARFRPSVAARFPASPAWLPWPACPPSPGSSKSASHLSPPSHPGHPSRDNADNRVSEQRDNLVMQGAFNNLNQLTGLGGGGIVPLQGTVSKPANVAVNGKASTLETNLAPYIFTYNLPVITGTNNVTITALDGSGNASTNQYQIVVPAVASTAPTYDADGNCTSDGTRSYQWDALNRLIQISEGSNTYQFAYDGQSRRISETDNGTLTKRWVWRGSQMAVEQNAANTTTKRFYSQGEQQSSTAYYYTRDHLGSVREMVDGSGTIQARYSYDSYGRQTKISGSLDSTFQYTGDYYHSASALNLTLNRAYDPNTGRWLSRDPIAENGGINLYGYVLDNPTNSRDPLGLCQTTDDAGATCGCDKISVVTLSTDTDDFPPHSFITTKVGGWGFFPAIPYAPMSPGTVENNTSHHRNHYQVYRACPSTLSKLLRSISSHTGGWYDGLNGPPGNNCTGWACNRLSDAGFTPPANGNQPCLTPYNTK